MVRRNGCRKGKRVERELAKLLSQRFGKEFSRSVGSGNRWAQVNAMPTAAKETFAGDLCVPDGFLWSIEAKGGYDDLSLYSLLLGCPTIESWLAQVAHDAEQSGRKPLICWRQSWKPWMAILRRRDAWPLDSGDDRYIVMGDWCGVLLDDLLQAKNEMFFKEEG